MNESFSTMYLTLQPIHKDEKTVDFYRFLQLLNFIKDLQSQKSTVAYGQVTYLSYQIPHFNTYFSDHHYRSLVFFPFVEVKKINNTWSIILVSCEELVDLFCSFPFHLPKVFRRYKSKYSLWTQVFLLQAFAQKKLHKRLNTEAFFLELSLGDSGYRQVKTNLLLFFNHLITFQIIQSDFLVTLKNGKVKNVQKLNSNLISRSKYIDFYENLGL
jgi:hypothetical protein